MEPPEAGELAHDLVNIVGVVRSMALDLKTVIASEPDEVTEALAQLDRQTEYATEALRVVERRNQIERAPVHLGAWAWSLRLWVRSLALGDLSAATERPRIALAPALAAGVAMVRAIHPSRPVTVEWNPEGLWFETSTDAHDPAALTAALTALERCGLHAERTRAVPCCVRVFT